MRPVGYLKKKSITMHGNMNVKETGSLRHVEVKRRLQYRVVLMLLCTADTAQIAM